MQNIDVGKASETDLGKFQELFAAVQHLANIEDHLIDSAMESGNEEYLAIHAGIRKLRAKYLKLLVTHQREQVWCCSKHIAAVVYRLKECAIKWHSAKDINTAMTMLEDAKELTALFYYLNSGGSEHGKNDEEKL
jgi:hypothetical protein